MYEKPSNKKDFICCTCGNTHIYNPCGGVAHTNGTRSHANAGQHRTGRPYDGVDFGALMAPGSGIYYGTYNHATSLLNVEYGTATLDGTASSILWRVMGEENGDGNITLLSEYVLVSHAFNPTTSDGNKYENSSIQQFLAGTMMNSFTTTEQQTSAMAQVNVETKTYELGVVNNDLGTYNSSSTNQQIYLPWGLWESSSSNYDDSIFWSANGTISSTEADNLNNSIYRKANGAEYEAGKAYLKGDAGGTEIFWWLRSPYSNDSTYALTVDVVGSVTNGSVNYTLGVRPAFKLNPASVIFTSEILSGADVLRGETLADGSNYDVSLSGGTNFKLTVVDNSLTAGTVTVNSANISTNPTETTAPGGTVAVSAASATTGTNLTYKIVDASHNIVGYGQGADNASLTVNAKNLNGTNLADGDYTVYVWAQENNAINSHGGSAPEYFTMTVDSTRPTITDFVPNGTSVSLIETGIAMIFSETMDTTVPGTITINGVSLTGTWYTDGKFLFAPFGTITLVEGASYTVSISGFQDLAGNVMNPDNSHGFTVETATTASPTITTTALPNGTVGTAYSAQLTASGDTPIAWTVGSGSLPLGLSLSSGGAITGTPTTEETANFTIKAENAIGDDTKALSISIAQGGTVIPPVPPTPTTPFTPSNRGSGSGGSSARDTASALPAAQTTYWLTSPDVQTALAKNGDVTRIARIGSVGIKPVQTKLLGSKPFAFDTKLDNVVQVRVHFPNPALITKDTLLSGAVKGATAEARKVFFEKWFTNKLQIISLEQKGAWSQAVQVAAKVDLTAMNTDNLVFYSYNKASNKCTRITNPKYWLDKNGYLHFTTELAGDIVISDGVLGSK